MSMCFFSRAVSVLHQMEKGWFPSPSYAPSVVIVRTFPSVGASVDAGQHPLPGRRPLPSRAPYPPDEPMSTRRICLFPHGVASRRDLAFGEEHPSVGGGEFVSSG